MDNKTVQDKRNEYRNNFNKRKYTPILIRFKRDEQEDIKILKHIKKQNNITEYIKNLVRKDI